MGDRADSAALRTRLLPWPASLAGTSSGRLADLLDRVALVADGHRDRAGG